MEEKLIEQSSVSRSAADTRVETLHFQGLAACPETMPPHLPALSHDLLAEAVKKNQPKPAYIKSNRTEYAGFSYRKGKLK